MRDFSIETSRISYDIERDIIGRADWARSAAPSVVPFVLRQLTERPPTQISQVPEQRKFSRTGGKPQIEAWSTIPGSPPAIQL
jgi:hypothetical protein